MRLILILFLLLSTSAAAWEFTPVPVCTLSHETAQADVRITHDPAVREYRLDLVLNGGTWQPAPSFGIAFSGPRALTIGTDRHRLAGRILTVTDRGFGNVLNGLEFNRVARAFTEQQAVDLDLEGAAEPVRQFRRCAEALPMS